MYEILRDLAWDCIHTHCCPCDPWGPYPAEQLEIHSSLYTAVSVTILYYMKKMFYWNASFSSFLTWTHPKFKLLRAFEVTLILSVDGLGITWRPGDIFFTSQAKEVGLPIQDTEQMKLTERTDQCLSLLASGSKHHQLTAELFPGKLPGYQWEINDRGC